MRMLSVVYNTNMAASELERAPAKGEEEEEEEDLW